MARRSVMTLIVSLAVAIAVGTVGPRPAWATTHKTASKNTSASRTAKAGKAGKPSRVQPGKDKGKSRGKEGSARAAKAEPPPVVGGRVAVFVFKGEEASAPIRTEVVNLLRSKGLEVDTTLLPVDSAVQYRDMAATLGLAVYVHGEVRDDGERAKAVVHIRSGVTGRKIKSVRFQGASTELRADVGKSLWGEVGPAFARTCAAAAKPRKIRAPLRIEAGTPLGPSDT